MPERNDQPTGLNARLMSLQQLTDHVIPLFIQPTPHRKTLERWLKEGRIPRFKQNPLARNGGGTVYYSVSAVEKYFRDRVAPNRVTVAR